MRDPDKFPSIPISWPYAYLSQCKCAFQIYKINFEEKKQILKIFVYLKGRVSKKGKDKQRKKEPEIDIFCTLVHSLVTAQVQSQTEASTSELPPGLPHGRQRPGYLAVFYCCFQAIGRIGNRPAEISTDVHIGCWHHNWWLYQLYKNSPNVKI